MYVAAVIVAVGFLLAPLPGATTYQSISNTIMASKTTASSLALSFLSATKAENSFPKKTTNPTQSSSSYVSALSSHTTKRFLHSLNGLISHHQREALFLIIAAVAVSALVIIRAQLRLYSELKHVRTSESAKVSKILILKAAEISKDREITNLHSEVKALRQFIASKAEDIDDHWLQDRSDLEKQVHRLGHNLDARNIEVEEAKLKMGDMLTEIGEKEDTVESLESEIRLLRGENAQVEARVAGVQYQMETIEQMKQDEINRLQANYNKLEDERASLQEDNHLLNREIETLKVLSETSPLKVDLSEESGSSHTTRNTIADEGNDGAFRTHQDPKHVGSSILEEPQHPDGIGMSKQSPLARALTISSEAPLSVTPLRVSAPAFVPAHECFEAESNSRQTICPQAYSTFRNPGESAEHSSTQNIEHRRAKNPHIAAINEKLAESKTKLQAYERNVKFMGRLEPGEEGTPLSDSCVGKLTLRPDLTPLI